MSGLIDPADSAFVITPSDTENLEQVTRGLYVGVAGDVRAVTAAGNTITFTALAAGIVHPLRIRQVTASGTTAESILGVY
jgi:hypothetical protein